MRHHRHFTIGIIALFVLSSTTLGWAELASDDEYMEEIKQEVFYPCYEEMMKHNGLEGMVTAKDFHLYMKLTDETTRQAETVLLNQVRGKPKQARAIAYMLGLKSCINGVKRSQVR